MIGKTQKKKAKDFRPLYNNLLYQQEKKGPRVFLRQNAALSCGNIRFFDSIL
jgi:hypothetical protein